MNYFLVLNGRKLKNVATVALTALVTAWFLYIQNVSLPVFSTESGPKAFYKGKEGLALTFNIAWGDEMAEPIIDGLTEKNVKAATFFLSGSWAERHPHIVEKIVKAGYEIGILGYDYLDYEELEDREIQRDILKAEEVFRKLDVKYQKLLRAPNGHYDQRFLNIAEKLGYSVVHWSVNTNDWKNPGVNAIVESAKKAKKGDILLFHASDSATQTAVALPKILDEFEKRKTKFVTVSDMIIEGKVKTKEVH